MSTHDDSSTPTMHARSLQHNQQRWPSQLVFATWVQVSTAVRLCDGALVVVDAVEGVCVQTHAVLRQAWAERVTPALVINKVDRLISELQLSPAEAYERLGRIVEEANSVLAALTSAQFLQRADESAEAEHAECDPLPCSHRAICVSVRATNSHEWSIISEIPRIPWTRITSWDSTPLLLLPC